MNPTDPKQVPSVLTKDDSGHWYLIPCAALCEFDAWVEAMELDKDWTGLDFNECLIDSPYRLTILAWEKI